MPSWCVWPRCAADSRARIRRYDIKGLDSRAKEPCDGLDDSLRHVAGLIDKEIAAGVPANRIVVAGFSQGGAMALLAGLTHPRSLGGVVCAWPAPFSTKETDARAHALRTAMSGYLPRPSEFAVHKANANTPVLFCHGDEDDVVQIQCARSRDAGLTQTNAGARASAARVKEAGATRVDFKTYRGMEHSACRAEIDDVIAFVRAVVSDLESDGDDDEL